MPTLAERTTRVAVTAVISRTTRPRAAGPERPCKSLGTGVREILEKGLDGIEAGHEIVILTWLHEAQRDVLAMHPRDNLAVPLRGVFATRSPDRPNPVGLHRVTVLRVGNDGWLEVRGLEVRGLEAIDGTPVIDIKPVLARSRDW